MRSFDGTPIVMHFFGASGLSPGERAPTVLVGPGFPAGGNTDDGRIRSDAIGVTTLRIAGYNVLTWDPRGLGGSGGTVMFDSPDFEARDVRSLVDFIAAQPEALLDAAGDPRVGMSGSSYGGAIQLASSAIDARIDAIVPDLSWNSLPSSLFKDGAVKLGWFEFAICGGGHSAAIGAGLLFGSAGLQLGGVDPSITRACSEAAASGRISDASTRWFAGRGPGALLAQIQAPALILQGTHDALFPLGESAANFEQLRRRDVPVKMMWHCSGHNPCLHRGAQPARVAEAGLAWLQRWLKRDVTVDTGPTFEWIADDGAWRSGPDFPLAPSGTIDVAGAGTLPVNGEVAKDPDTLGATPATNALELTFPAAPAGSDLIGAPSVDLAYRGVAVPPETFLFAQILAPGGGRVVGSQATPIPVVLDGRTRSIRRPLEMIAARAGSDSRYRLQITPASSVYGVQRSVGSVTLQRIAASLPLVDATRSGRPGSAAVARRTPRRLRVRTTSRRVRGRSRVLLSSKLRSRPCSGSVRFKVRVAGLKRIKRVKVRRSCQIRAVVYVRVRRDRRARVSARYEGNSALSPRRAHSRAHRLR